MSDDEQIDKALAESLAAIERAVAAWRRGELDVRAAHAEIVRQIARSAAIVAPLPPKREVFAKLLAGGPVLLHVDARRPDVDVPAAHRAEPRLVLRIGHGLQPPIPDLETDEHGITCTLTFRGVPHACKLPWDAIYAIVSEDGRGLVWPDSVPSDVATEFGEREEPPEPPEPPKGKPKLKLV